MASTQDDPERVASAPQPGGDDVPTEARTVSAGHDPNATLKAAFSQRHVGPFAELTCDSLLDGLGTGAAHELHFSGTEVRIAVRVLAAPSGSTVSGSIDPATPGRVYLASAVDGAQSTPLSTEPVASTGTFEFPPVPRGTYRLVVVDGAGTHVVTTDWFRLGA